MTGADGAAATGTGAVLEQWWARVDGDAPGDPLELLADDVRFSLTFAGTTHVGGRNELAGYVRDRIAEGRRHHILMSTVVGAVEIVAGELREHSRPIASFVGGAERDADGRIKHYLISSSAEMRFAFPGSAA